ncbi:MAG: acylphosphatase [Acidobacteria bacterium]|jgi:acylphosphatase|nr:acylphosphatase [Acidobacteriota bacterium]
MKTYHYIVKGRVQGVSFRYYTQRAAFRLGITGTVKNLTNGDVEVYAQGKQDAIKEFEAFLHRGPVPARVEHVIKEEFEVKDEYPEFEITF